MDINKVLVVSPHPDDILLGCGGTMAKFIEEGKEVWCVIISWRGQGFDMAEIENSILTLGLKRNNIIIWDYPVRELRENQKQLLEDLIGLRNRIQPELIFCHSTDDRHQDHQTARQETYRAFRWYSIWGYELPWNTRNFKADIFVPLLKRHIDIKIRALNCILSQGQRLYYDPKKREANAIAIGEKIGQDYAENFESISQIV